MNSQNTLCSWSGGKDSCYALMLAKQEGYLPKVLLNVLNEEGKISRSHGIPLPVLERQAKAANLELYAISSSWQDYEKKFIAALESLKEKHDLSFAVFGDIDLQEHRDWEEKVCEKAGLKAILPLWLNDRKELINQMLKNGIETMIISCNEQMGEEYLGNIITPSLIDQLENLGIDPCGENGEFHTLVLNCPLFDQRISIQVQDTIKHENYWFLQVA